MRLRPINDTVIVEPDPILKHEGLIVLSDKNSVEKISPYATVVSWGNKCTNHFKVGQKILLPTVNSPEYETPLNFIIDNKKYRMIRERLINAIIED